MMASSILRERATRVWLLLVLATLLTYGLAEGHGVSARTATTAALLIAAFKARLVFLDFMELRTAPWPWRLAFEAWAVVSVVAILGGYWLK
jgi:heme/copper-type cytochrome/quinol oxidase subunit 4